MNTVQKFIFIQENNFNGSKLTFESSSVSLDQILTDFADFLRGCGFQINGYLDVINPDEEWPESACDSELDYDHPEANFDYDWSGEKDQISLCPVCKIDTNTMKDHDCFDKNCPKVN